MFNRSETELTTAATDALLGPVCLAAAFQLVATPTPAAWKRGLWVGVFGLLSCGSWLGALAHGLEWSDATRAALWRPLYLSLGLAVALMFVGAVHDWWGEAASRQLLPWALGAGVLFFALTQILGGAFVLFLVYEGAATGVALDHLRGTRHHRWMPGAGAIAAGIALSLLAAAVQASDLGVRVIVRFDHNALFHVVQIASVIVLASGLRTACGWAPRVTGARGIAHGTRCSTRRGRSSIGRPTDRSCAPFWRCENAAVLKLAHSPAADGPAVESAAARDPSVRPKPSNPHAGSRRLACSRQSPWDWRCRFLGAPRQRRPALHRSRVRRRRWCSRHIAASPFRAPRCPHRPLALVGLFVQLGLLYTSVPGMHMRLEEGSLMPFYWALAALAAVGGSVVWGVPHSGQAAAHRRAGDRALCHRGVDDPPLARPVHRRAHVPSILHRRSPVGRRSLRDHVSGHLQRRGNITGRDCRWMAGCSSGFPIFR